MICFPSDLTQYEFIREFASNDNSTTYMARCSNNDQVVSIKKIDLENHPYSENFLKGEMRFWSEMDFVNIKKYYGSVIKNNELYIFTEYATYGSLLEIMHYQYPNGIEDELLIASLLREILKFLESFHLSFHIHRMLETKNIFVGQNGNILIGGFWGSRSLIQNGKLKEKRKSKICPSLYTAPELIIGNEYNQSVDIWSIGIIAYELAIGKTPYSENNPLLQIKSIIDNEPPLLPFSKKDRFCEQSKELMKKSVNADSRFNFSSNFRNFVQLCLQKDPKKRPTASKLLNHKFISGAKGVDYIYSNMVAQLPHPSLIFSAKEKKLKRERENLMKRIDFDFCDSASEKIESNNEYNDLKNYKIQTPHSIPLLDKKRFKSRSQSKFNINSNNNYSSCRLDSDESMKTMKKGRFSISYPI